jgi:hypothetical protein
VIIYFLGDKQSYVTGPLPLVQSGSESDIHELCREKMRRGQGKSTMGGTYKRGETDCFAPEAGIEQHRPDLE